MAARDDDLLDRGSGGTSTGIHERSPSTTSVGHSGHGGGCCRHLAPRHDHGRRRPPPAIAAVRVLRQMLSRLLLEHRARRREQRSVGETRVDRLVGARERDVGPRQLGSLTGDGRVDVQRRIEQHRALDPVGPSRGKLGDELAAEAVTEPGPRSDAERGSRLDEVGDVLLDAPRRLPARSSVPAVVDADDAVRLRAAPRPAGESGGRGP